MDKIRFDETTFIWRKKLGLQKYKSQLLKESANIIESQPDVKQDGFGIINWVDDINSLSIPDKTNKVIEIVKIGVDESVSLYLDNNIPFNKINVESWLNRVRHENPVQSEYWRDGDKYHTHSDLNKKLNSFYPNFTFVYYIQMPDIMNEDDGMLYFKNKEGIEYCVRPEEDELIIMEGDMPHFPKDAPNSTIDRIVIAGNVGFNYIKKQKSLL
jgi:hypothetical protein